MLYKTIYQNLERQDESHYKALK